MKVGIMDFDKFSVFQSKLLKENSQCNSYVWKFPIFAMYFFNYFIYCPAKKWISVLLKICVVAVHTIGTAASVIGLYKYVKVYFSLARASMMMKYYVTASVYHIFFAHVIVGKSITSNSLNDFIAKVQIQAGLQHLRLRYKVLLMLTIIGTYGTSVVVLYLYAKSQTLENTERKSLADLSFLVSTMFYYAYVQFLMPSLALFFMQMSFLFSTWLEELKDVLKNRICGGNLYLKESYFDEFCKQYNEVLELVLDFDSQWNKVFGLMLAINIHDSVTSLYVIMYLHNCKMETNLLASTLIGSVFYVGMFLLPTSLVHTKVSIFLWASSLPFSLYIQFLNILSSCIRNLKKWKTPTPNKTLFQGDELKETVCKVSEDKASPTLIAKVSVSFVPVTSSFAAMVPT